MTGDLAYVEDYDYMAMGFYLYKEASYLRMKGDLTYVETMTGTCFPC